MDDVPVEKIKDFQGKFMDFLDDAEVQPARHNYKGEGFERCAYKRPQSSDC